jgi:hypothetical protein
VRDFVKAQTSKTLNDAACAGDLYFAIKSSVSVKHEVVDWSFNSSHESKRSRNDHERVNSSDTITMIFKLVHGIMYSMSCQNSLFSATVFSV